MYRTLAKETLGRLWAVLAAARERVLTEEDRREIARLCEMLQTLPGVTNEIFRTRAEELCLTVVTGLDLLSPQQPAKVDVVLDHVDALRDFVSM